MGKENKRATAQLPRLISHFPSRYKSPASPPTCKMSLYAAASQVQRSIKRALNAAMEEDLMREGEVGYTPTDLKALRARLEAEGLRDHLETCKRTFDWAMAAHKDAAWEVGIRPKEGTPFKEFHDKVILFVTAALWDGECVFTFEQKGTSDDTLGQGFHAHIVGKSSRTKSAIVKEAKRRFGAWCPEPNVRKLTRVQEYIQDYFIDYKCDDHDKASTKEWDAKWRAANELLPLYGDPSAFANV